MPARVLVVAFDACDIGLALPWAAQGRLPALQALLAEAMTTETRSAPGLYAGSVWPSLMTGVSPARHRRYYQQQARNGAYEDVDFRPGDMAAAPFWETLSRAGRRVAVVDVPLSRLSSGLNGIQVVDWTGHDPCFEPGLSTPADLLPELNGRFGAQAPDRCDDIERTATGIADFVRHLQARITCKLEGSCALLGRDDWDLFLTAFSESHCVGHQLFHQHERGHPLHDGAVAAAVGDPVLAVYQSLDRALGRLIAEAGPQTTFCALLSHGMGPAYIDENVVLDDVLRRIEGLGGTGTRSWYGRLRRQWYRIPLRVRQARPVSALRARLLPALHRSLLFPERSTRRFFMVPNNAVAGAIRLNLVGRDANGKVPPEEYDAVCEELRRELLALVDTGGERWARDVVRTRGRYRGPYADELPDLLVEWNRPYPIAEVASARLGAVRPPAVTGRTGDHRNHGLFLARGPGIPRGRRPGTAAVEDVAPTLARLVGVALDDVDGTPIGECLP